MKELAMTKEQYDLVIKEIEENHYFGKSFSTAPNSKHIKYVRPNWDMRDGMCFSIQFDGLSCGMGGKAFGSGHLESEPLYDRVMNWLKSDNPALIPRDGRHA
ncbi:hypothetical protein [Paenibacillus sp. NEAU-GSW1]|uniref:hypothetical protein n=1 Tax=Paenibacillus sp. NEAU-GSW1 TaxID=2682486 RepID=UPI0012E2CFE5|nr:hypothetical protein [Paenibacillus sp. NEAU-GSW1]MUT66041.1 hypothetical protein [Paenibacillus sp. NEAU-GSW1]